MLGETKMSLERQSSHNTDLQENGEWYYWALAVELVMFVAIVIY